MSEVRRAVVIGGGAAGCAAAYYLSLAGVRVTIVEREGIGSQASGWSAGGLNPLQGIPDAISALAMQSYRLHLGLWSELERLTGRDLEARIISVALAAPDEAAIPELLTLRSAFEATDGFSAEWLDTANLLEVEARIAPHVVGALMTHGNGILESHTLTLALADAAVKHGAAVQAGEVTGLRHSNRRVTGVILADGEIACDAVVLALGPWSGSVEAWLGGSWPVEPLKGEIVRVAPTGPPLACDVVTPEVSLFGRTAGQVWIGATQERRGFDREPSTAAYETLFGAATRLMPSLNDATLVKQTVCLRPVTPDGLPIVGAAPEWEGVFMVTGGGTKGILLAPAMGQAVSDLIVTGETAISVEACGPGRFASVSRAPA